MIQYLLDANTAVYAMQGAFEALREKIVSHDPGEVAISVISYAEVAYGSHAGKPPEPEILDAFIEAIPLLPFNEAAAREYAKLPFKRARFDRFLAAHALSIGATVVTNNVGDFADVPGLVVENWTV